MVWRIYNNRHITKHAPFNLLPSRRVMTLLIRITIDAEYARNRARSVSTRKAEEL